MMMELSRKLTLWCVAAFGITMTPSVVKSIHHLAHHDNKSPAPLPAASPPHSPSLLDFSDEADKTIEYTFRSSITDASRTGGKAFEADAALLERLIPVCEGTAYTVPITIKKMDPAYLAEMEYNHSFLVHGAHIKENGKVIPVLALSEGGEWVGTAKPYASNATPREIYAAVERLVPSKPSPVAPYACMQKINVLAAER